MNQQNSLRQSLKALGHLRMHMIEQWKVWLGLMKRWRSCSDLCGTRIGTWMWLFVEIAMECECEYECVLHAHASVLMSLRWRTKIVPGQHSNHGLTRESFVLYRLQSPRVSPES